MAHKWGRLSLLRQQGVPDLGPKCPASNWQQLDDALIVGLEFLHPYDPSNYMLPNRTSSWATWRAMLAKSLIQRARPTTKVLAVLGDAYELALCGYAAEDLLLQTRFRRAPVMMPLNNAQVAG
jgi:hypothetical protein